MHPVLSLVVGVGLAALGGELFVRGVVGVAAWARIPAGVIGATVAAFATSSPELSVAVVSAREGVPQISLGNALGANVLNVGLVLGVALLMGPFRGQGKGLGRDLPFAFLAPTLTLAVVADGGMNRLDAALLLGTFAVWLAVVVRQARQSRDATAETVGEQNRARAVLESAGGLAALVFAGTFIVEGAQAVGEALGWTPLVVGATLVAAGTCMPELATTLISRARGHDEVGLGNVIGSNIFNNLFIVGVAATIRPYPVQDGSLGLTIVAGVATLAACLPNREGTVPRWRGFVLLGLYAAYTFGLVVGDGGFG